MPSNVPAPPMAATGAPSHQKDIASFKKEAAANDGEASALAKQQLPVLEKHLQIAERLQKK